MTALGSSFIAGFGIGLAVAAPIGPMGLLCIQRTLSSGLPAGLVTGLGAATVHTIYGAAGLVGAMAWLEQLLRSDGWVLQLASAALLAFFAVRLLSKRADGEFARKEVAPLLQSYQSAVALGLTNPLTLLLLIATIPALLGQNGSGGLEMVAGISCGSVSWWLVLSLFVSLVHRRINSRALRVINITCALCLFWLAGTAVRTALVLSMPEIHAD